MTLFLAGHETTALALTYTLWLLASHPEAYERLLAEVDTVLDGRDPGPEDWERLSYTSAVVKESLRVYPPVWTMARLATDGVEIGGVRLNAGEQVIMPQWVVQRDERWFPEPEAFRPERFEESAEGVRHRLAWMPFGAGHRTCVGNHFAMIEGPLLLALIAQRYEMSLLPGQTVEPEVAVTVRPRNGLKMTIQKR